MLRRSFLRSTALSSLGIGLGMEPQGNSDKLTARTFNILQYGAVPDGHTLNTRQIQAAIEDASKQGGGVVYVPPGTFVTGGLTLRSHITLYLEAGSVLSGSGNTVDYEFHPGPPTDGDTNGRHLIFARDCVDIEISGPGTIDGNGAAFRKHRNRKQPAAEDLWRDVISTDWMPSTTQRPSPMLEFAYCSNLRLMDITLSNAAGWTLRPAACKTVSITRVRIRNPVYAPNSDGMDICCSENVFVSDCDIDVGDDAICLKSENPYGPSLLTRNVVVTNCVLSSCVNGFKIGTGTAGAFENIVFSNSVIYNDDVAYNYRVIAGVAIEMVDGGSVDGVVISDIRMQRVRTPIFVRLEHRTVNAKTFLRNVTIRGIDATGAIVTSSITGMKDAPVDSVSLSDIRIRTEEGGRADWGRPQVPEVPSDYPEARMFGRLPSYGIYVRHAKNVRFRNIEIVSGKQDFRPSLSCEDVEDLVVSGYETSSPVRHDPVLEMTNCKRVFIQGSRSPDDTEVFLKIGGAASEGIAFAGKCFDRAKRIYSCVDGALESSVSVQAIK
jgi:polygalacturonase